MKDIGFYESFPATARALKTRRPIFGFGVNDAPFFTQFHFNGKLLAHPAYLAWKSMIARCYDQKYKSKFATYEGVTVCDEWRSFMSFREWWLDRHVEGWHLDKDLLSGDRHYSPNNCIFIPMALNMFLTDSAASRGEFAIGCSRNKSGLFVSYVNNPISNTKEWLGTFATEDDAHSKWKKRKLQIAHEMKQEMDAIDKRIFDMVILKIKSMR